MACVRLTGRTKRKQRLIEEQGERALVRINRTAHLPFEQGAEIRSQPSLVVELGDVLAPGNAQAVTVSTPGRDSSAIWTFPDLRLKSLTCEMPPEPPDILETRR